MLNFKVDPAELYNGRHFSQMGITELLDAYEELANDADLADEDDADEVEMLSRYAKCRSEIVRRIEATRDLNHAVAESLAHVPTASPVAGVSAGIAKVLEILDGPMFGASPEFYRKQAASILRSVAAQPSAEGDGWIAEPTEQGWWWHIDAGEHTDMIPFMYGILLSGTNGKMFIQYPDSRWCSDVGGLWAKATPPALPAKEGTR